MHPAKIIGTINTTPDSFYEKSRCTTLDAVIEKAKKMIAEGADFIDLGGESTRPGAIPISAEEELQRILPAVQELSKLGIPLSVDTYKAEVAEKAIQAGAKIINDVSGGKYDPQMLPVVAKYQVHIVLMHNPIEEKQLPHATRKPYVYQNVVEEVVVDLKTLAERAESFGIPKENIILDPGIGFGKSVEDNIVLLRNISEIKKLGYQTLVGVSRKKFIGKILSASEDSEASLYGSIACAVIAQLQGIDYLRVHDVAATVQVVKMAIEVDGSKD